MSSQTDVFFQRILTAATTRGASDVHFVAGQPPFMRIDGALVPYEEEGVLSSSVMEELAELVLDAQARQEFAVKKRAVVARAVGARARVKIIVEYRQGSPAMSLHVLTAHVPTLQELGLPKVMEELARARKGLILIIGPHDSGRTTTVASLLDAINAARAERIVSLEDPVEYVLEPRKSLVEQREVGRDVPGFADGLRALKDTDVNVVAVSSLDDRAAFETLMDLVEGGRLGIAAVEAETVDEALEFLVQSFAAHERERLLHALAEVLVAVAGLRLVSRVGGGRVQVAEVLVVTAPVRALLRDGRFAQISSWMTSSREGGTISLDRALAELVKTGEVLMEDALAEVADKENFQRLVQARPVSA